MADKPKSHERGDVILSSLNMAIDGLNLAKEFSSITPATPVFGTVAVLLTMIRPLSGMSGKKLQDLNKSVRDAIGQLTRTVTEIQGEVIKQGERHSISRFFHARNDKETIAGWRSDLNRILHVFNTELAMNIYTTVIDVHRSVSKPREAADSQNVVTQKSASQGELPPPPPKIFFGREELIQRIANLAEDLTSIALLGAGGIGKTSIVLTALHDNRIKERFGDNRWFIRCDQFPPSHTNFLRRLSKAIGAGIENPEDLTPLRRCLSSKEMLIVLDNAESVLDARGTNAQDIYSTVDELSQFSNICLVITSRISTIPPHCEIIDIPTLSMEAASKTFYRIYRRNERSDSIESILKELDFHPLSITLLATVAQQNQWDTRRLVAEWEKQRTGVLRAQHLRSLAATIELSLASPMFQELGPDARLLLEAVAFFPRGVNEDNIDWLLPTISDGPNIFDKLCMLSLTYRSRGFVTMLAPLRDYLRPKDPMSSPLLNTIRESYFTRLSTNYVLPGEPSFDESRWIVSEDVNLEYLLDILTSTDTNSENTWNACTEFMDHIRWHKPRLVVLGPKIEALPDGHPFKAPCLLILSRLLHSVGNFTEQKRILTLALNLEREQGNDLVLAHTLNSLADVNRMLGLIKEGIQQAKEASEVLGWVGNAVQRAESLIVLSSLLLDDKQLDAAEEAASRAISFPPEKGQQYLVCQGHRILGMVYCSKGDTEKSIHHLEVALEIASSRNVEEQLFWIHFNLATVHAEKGGFDDARAHVEHAKSWTIDQPYLLAHASELWARCLAIQDKFEEAKSEALRALEVFEKLGATNDAEVTRKLIEKIDGSNAQRRDSDVVTADKPDDNDRITQSE